MIIIYEGADCVGKTTLVMQTQKAMLHRGITPHTLKASRPVDGVHPLHEYALPILTAPSEHLICDRWHVGEDVYGPLYRSGSRLTPAQRIWLDMFMASRGAVFVHVTADVTSVLQRYDSRGDDYLRREDVGTALEQFEFQTADHQHWYTANTTMHPLDTMYDVAWSIVNLAVSRWAVTAPILNVATDYVGPWNPYCLIVGDRPALGADALPAYGAFTPWNGNSAEYLINALCDGGVLAPRQVPEIGFVNSYGFDLALLHKELGGPPVVALGAEALRCCRAANLPIVGSAYHPQYYRRFKHHERAGYGQELAELTRICLN